MNAFGGGGGFGLSLNDREFEKRILLGSLPKGGGGGGVEG